MSSKAHWEKVYAGKAPTEVSWFQPRAALSLALIEDAGVPRSAPIIDVGGGASRLADDLLAAGFENITVLDLSGTALAAARQRLGARSGMIHWQEADVLEADLPVSAYEVWHDRAVFHFLTRAEDRRRYVAALKRALRPGGLVIIAAFAVDGPTRCSGLPVVRYAPESLHAELGSAFRLVRGERELHRTPGGRAQQFVYCAFRRSTDGGP